MVKYIDGKAHQFLAILDGYHLDGTFDEAAIALRRSKKRFTDTYIKKPASLRDKYGDNPHIDALKTVQFEDVYLVWGHHARDQHYHFQVWGIRAILPEEVVGIEKRAEEAAKQERDREYHEYLRLKQKYEESSESEDETPEVEVAYSESGVSCAEAVGV